MSHRPPDPKGGPSVVQHPSNLKDATFEAMTVGEELGPIERDVDEHFIKSYCFTVDDWNPWYSSSQNPFARPVAPAASLVPDLLRLLNTRYDPNSEVGLHQKEEIWHVSPIFLGERAVMRGRFVDKYTKRGKGYVVTEAEARSAGDGRLLIRHLATEVARIEAGVELGAGSGRPESGRQVLAVWPPDRVPMDTLQGVTAAQGLVGTPILGPRRRVHQDQMSVFSNVAEFWHNIHTDLSVALRAGLPGTLAQGLMSSMYVSELGTRLFGPAWFAHGWNYLTYLRPVLAGDDLQCRGVVTQTTQEDSGIRVELEVWIQNGRDEKTAVGWLSCVLP